MQLNPRLRDILIKRLMDTKPYKRYIRGILKTKDAFTLHVILKENIIIWKDKALTDQSSRKC